MEPAEPKNTLYDLILPRVELLGTLAAALGLGLLLGYGQSSPALIVGFSTLALAFFLRAFQPPTAAAPAPAYVPVEQSAPPAGYLAVVADKLQGIAGAVALVGVLFQLLRWSGAEALLLVGLLSLAPVVAYQAATGRLTWRPALALGLGLAAWLAIAPLTRYAYRDDPTLAEKVIYQQAHPRDTAAYAEVQLLLRARRQRQ